MHQPSGIPTRHKICTTLTKYKTMQQDGSTMTIHTTPSCRIRSDCQTTSLTMTTGVCEAGTKTRGASNMNIHWAA